MPIERSLSSIKMIRYLEIKSCLRLEINPIQMSLFGKPYLNLFEINSEL